MEVLPMLRSPYMVDVLAAITALALLGGGGSALIAAVLGRPRLAVVLGAAGLIASAIAFVLIVVLIIPTVERRIGFLGAITAFVGLATMYVPFQVRVLSKTEPKWTDPLMNAGRILALVGLAGLAIFGVTSLQQRPG
jgi:uncharacterized membrane protein